MTLTPSGAATAAGGVGLFLLGMMLMTDGLKLAGGSALRAILGRWTSTPLRGVLLGTLITATLQSSSAVTVALIGFVNAGLLDLAQAVGVIYGSNVGTTMTGWLVSLVGLKIDVEAVALPCIGVGMVLRMIRGSAPGSGVGQALAGFGVFFLGISVLRQGFSGLATGGGLVAPAAQEGTFWLLAAGGVALTFLLQSSSAALALVLTATAGGVLSLGAGAAVVIGANVGTTTTAVLAVLGATSNARRVAAAHVTFNLLTGVLALLLLPALLPVLRWLHGVQHWESTAVLALFHTAFNVAGVLLMWPLTRPLLRFLQGRFRTAEEDEAIPRHLDYTVVSTPSLAVNALVLELGRVGTIARRMAEKALGPRPQTAELDADSTALQRLVVAVGEFAGALRRGDLPPQVADALPDVLRVSQYYASVAELSVALAARRRDLEPVADPELHTALERFAAEAAGAMDTAEPWDPAYSLRDAEHRLEHLDADYHRLKDRLLRAGSDGVLAPARLVRQLDQLSEVRRLAEQAAKGARYLHALAAVAAQAREPATVPSSE
ncbi:MAG: Na/Pi symporter [Gammaproteobacteria bacterium]